MPVCVKDLGKAKLSNTACGDKVFGWAMVVTGDSLRSVVNMADRVR